MSKFTKSFMLTAVALIPTSVFSAEPGVGSHLNTEFTAIQGNQVDIVIDPALVGRFWMHDGRIYKAYQENGQAVVREVLIDTVDHSRANAAIPASVWTDNGKLLVQHGRLTLQHNPRWQHMVRRDLIGTGRYVQVPSPILPNLLPGPVVPEAFPVDTLAGRILVSEWTVVAVRSPVWLKGTIEPYGESAPTEVPRDRILDTSPIPVPDPFFEHRAVEEAPAPPTLLIPPQK